MYHKIYVDSSNSPNSQTPTLFISCDKQESFVSTTINSKGLYFYELCLKTRNNLIPLSFMLNTNPMSNQCLSQWLNMFLEAEKQVFSSYYLNNDLNQSLKSNYVICDNSMPLVETLLKVFSNENFEKYSNRCFRAFLQNSKNTSKNLDNFTINFDQINNDLLNSLHPCDSSNSKINIHVCTNQFMFEIKKLCKQFYSFGNNFNFGMYAFSCIVNSESLNQLQLSLYAFMCILYSKSINSLVEKAFNYLKKTVNYYESLTKQRVQDSPEFYFYNFNSKLNEQYQQSPLLNENNTGLTTLKSYGSKSPSSQLEELKLSKLNNESVFYKMCELLFEKCKFDIENCEKEEENTRSNLPKNPRMGHKLLFHFINEFSSTIPLWTKLATSKSPHLPLTIQLHNERFDKIRSLLAPPDEEKDSVDIFIKKLEQEDQPLIEENVKIYGLNTTELISNRKSRYQSCLLSLIIDEASKDDSNDDDENFEIDSDEIEFDFDSKNSKNKNDMLYVSNSNLSAKKIKTNKNELIKPKLNMSKRLRPDKVVAQGDNNIQDQETSFFNIVCLTETQVIEKCDKTVKIVENEEREVVIQRQQHIVTNDFGFELTKEDLETLENPNSPNSNIIEFYLKFVEVSANSKLSSTEIFVYPVSFFPILKYGYQSNDINSNEDFCSSNSFYLNERFNVFEYKLVLVPIQKTDHWALAVGFHYPYLKMMIS